jgi:hypothetical protein
MPLTRRTRAFPLVLAVLLVLAACMAPGVEIAHASKQFGAKNFSWLGTAAYYKVGGTSNFYGSTLDLPGPTITPSPAYNGTQKVVVTRYLYQQNPTNWGELLNDWTLTTTRTTHVFLPARRKVTFSTWSVAVNPYSAYRVVYKVAYYTSGGRFLSSIFTDYLHAGDYQCWTDNCSINRGRDGRASIMLLY